MNLSTNEITVIGIDHGYGNIKTAHSCFKTGVAVYDKEPTFKNNLLIYDGKYYIIGEEHKEFKSDKMADEDYYVLTLAAIARELKVRNKTFATVHIAAGLPLTWVGEQKEEFKKYLLQNKFVDFSFRNVDYHIDFAGADIFPQGFAAVSDKLHCFKGTNMLADIGNGTMNVMYINNKKPVESKCYTEKLGVNQCVISAKNAVMDKLGVKIDDTIIEQVIRFGNADISEKYLNCITEAVREYCSEIFETLRKYEYNPDLMRLYVTGGGGCLIKNFGEYDDKRVTIIDDICATAKGYEQLAYMTLRKKVCND